MTAEVTPVAVPHSGHASAQAARHAPTTVQGATERLQQSRRVMREQMLALNTASAQAQAARRHPGALRTALRELPLLGRLISPLIDSAVAWWNSHPLREVASLFASRATGTGTTTGTNDSTSTAAADTATTDHAASASPLTHQPPWAMLASAAAAGALLMWLKPWRQRFVRRALSAYLVPSLVPGLCASMLSRLSADGWVQRIEELLRGLATTPAPTPTPAEQASAAPTESAMPSSTPPGSSPPCNPTAPPPDLPAQHEKRPA